MEAREMDLLASVLHLPAGLVISSAHPTSGELVCVWHAASLEWPVPPASNLLLASMGTIYEPSPISLALAAT